MNSTPALRPVYHYAPRANWLSDPNGLVYHAGEWHLFYQYNPQGETWGHMSWGHAVSRDLATWQELPPALLDNDQQMIFSGSAVVDSANTAGFGADALIALYTGSAASGPPHQVQCLAWSTDKGRQWQHYAANPVIDRGMADFRDPNVFWHAASQRWIMVVVLSAENRAVLYASANLKDWQELSDIPGSGAPGDVWECPLLIELPLEEGGNRWLFKVDALHGAPGSGALYQVGQFDGTRFTPESAWHVADWGCDFYAAIAWHEPRDAQGRPLWIGWLGNHAYQGKLPLQGWRGAMSLPRRIWLRREAGTYRLCQAVDPAAVAAVPVANLATRNLAAAARLSLGTQPIALRLSDDAGRYIQIDCAHGHLRIARHDPISPFLNAVQEASIAIGIGIDLWLDHGALEVLSTDGAVALTMQHRMIGTHLTCERAV